MRIAMVFGCVMVVVVAGWSEENGVADRPLHEIPSVAGPIAIDGHVNEAAWQDALELELSWEVEPGENVPAPVRTRVLLATDDRALYAAFIAEDPDPKQIRARYSDRDRMFADDWVHLVLDTFDDERRAFDFFVNPLGVQGDAVETTAGTFSDDWDAIWDSAGRITDEGYVVEMAIPFSSLRFQMSQGTQTWGLDVVRYYPRHVRHKLTSTPRDRNNNCYLCQISRVTGFAGASPGRNLEVTPTLTGILSEARDPFPGGPWVEQDSAVEAGLTARWGVTPNLALSGTVNPDFSQVEADAAQLDVNTRFSLFYPEKRPFFLEGADIFETPIRMVYTRTMANPNWGTKVTGKVGDGALGAFAVRDDVTNLFFPASEETTATSLGTSNTTSALRYRHDVGNAAIGGLVTDRRGDGYQNTVYGADLDFRLTPTDRIKLQLINSTTEYPDQVASRFGQPSGAFTGQAADFLYSHATRSWEVYAVYRGVSPGFRADAGFVPQAGYRYYDSGVLLTWQQDDPSHWYNFIKAWLGYEYTEEWDGHMLRSAPGTFVEYSGPYQISAFGIFYLGKQTYREKEYDDRTFNISMDIRPIRDLELGMRAVGGDAVDFAGERPGRRLRLTPSMTWFAGRRLNLEASWIHETFNLLRDEVSDGGRLYTAELAELKTVFQFNHRAFVRLILQYGDTTFEADDGVPESRERDLASQLLFSYKVNPWTALYVGYSDLSLGAGEFNLKPASRTAFVKVGYAFVP